MANGLNFCAECDEMICERCWDHHKTHLSMKIVSCGAETDEALRWLLWATEYRCPSPAAMRERSGASTARRAAASCARTPEVPPSGPQGTPVRPLGRRVTKHTWYAFIHVWLWYPQSNGEPEQLAVQNS